MKRIKTSGISSDVTTRRWVALLVVFVVLFQLSYLMKLAFASRSAAAAAAAGTSEAGVTRQYSFYFFGAKSTTSSKPTEVPPAENLYRPVWGVTNGTESGNRTEPLKMYPGILLSLVMATRNDGYGGASSLKRVSITLRTIDRMVGKCETSSSSRRLLPFSSHPKFQRWYSLGVDRGGVESAGRTARCRVQFS